MSNSALFALLLAAGALTPVAALGQRPMELAMAGPQPHFVAAWAPKTEREAERSAVLAGRVSLELADVSLDAALKALTNQAGLRITYSRAVLPAGKRVTISANDVAVVTALTEMLFRSGLDVVVDRDGTLALVVCRHPAGKPEAEVQDSGAIAGTVTDKATGAPLAGATVTVGGTGWNATTGTDGRYRISGVEVGAYTIRARYIGYAALSSPITVDAGREVSADFGLVKSVQKLDDVVTTGTFVPTEVKALPTPISVISADDIAQQRPQALLDVIRQAVPTAVAFDRPFASTVQTFFSVRGVSSLSGSSPLKILVDGVEATTFTLAPVDPTSIERIEVVRGPQAAAIYGADAAGGVIQIFTKRGDPGLTRPKVDMQAGVGVVQTPYGGHREVLRQEYTGSVRGSGGDVTYNFGGGYTRLADYVPNGELSRQSTPSVYGGMHFARGIVSADLSARYYRNKLPATLNPILLTSGFVPFSRPLHEQNDHTNETYGARITLAPTSWWRNQLTVGVDRRVLASTQTQRRFTTPEDTLFAVSNSQSRKTSVAYHGSVSADLDPNLGGSLTIGIDHYERDANSFSTSQALNTDGTIETSPPGAVTQNRATTTNTGYLTQAQVSIGDALYVTAGLRAEESSTFGADLGTPVLPRVGLSFVQEIAQATVKLRASWGRAIRVPSPGQAFGSASSFQINLPNTMLAPERQRGWDAGVDLTFGNRASLSVTGFNQTAEDLIVYLQVASTPLPTYQFQNLGRVTNRGIEVEGTLAYRALLLKAQYGYVRSRIAELGPAEGSGLKVGDQPEGVPTHTAGAALTFTPREGTSLTAGMTYVGSQRNTDGIALFQCLGGTGPCPSDFTFAVTYPGFTKFNAAVAHRLSRALEGFVSIDNLTNNQAYESDNSNPVFGRTTMAGLRFTY